MQRNSLGILILTLFYLLRPLGADAQTLHAILFAATEDSNIGKGNALSARMISAELRRIGISVPSLDVQIHSYYGKSCNPQAMEAMLQEFQGQDFSDDVFFFAFMGHGYNDPLSYTEWPHMLLMNTNGPITEEELNQNAYPLHLLVDRLEQLGPRLVIAYVEACNNFVDTGNPSFRIPDDVFVPAPPQVIKTEKYEDLFLRSAGTMVFTSSSKEEASYVSNLEGGIFTQAFIKALHEEVTNPDEGPASFQSLFQSLRKEARRICERTDKKQTPQFTEFPSKAAAFGFQEAGGQNFKGFSTSVLAPNPVRKNMELALASGDLEALWIEIAPGEDGDKQKNKILRKTPLMYYVSQALAQENRKDTALALLYYRVAQHLLTREKLFTKEDLELMESMATEDVYERTGIQEFKDFYAWLRYKSGHYQTLFDDRIRQAEGFIQNQEKEIEFIKRSIQEDRMQINYLLQEQDKLTTHLEEIDVQREQIATIDLPNFQKLQQEELAHLDALFEEVRQGAFVDDQKMEMLGDNTVQFSFSKRHTDANLQPSGKGFKLGDYCSSDLQQTSEGLMQILLASIDRVPEEQRRQIQVNLRLTGHADWQGGNQLLGIRYKAERDLHRYYLDQAGKEQLFQITSGQEKAITNQELAFLRAYCVFETIEALLLKKGLLPSQISVEFKAIAHQKPAKRLKGDDPGKDYRGFDLDLSLQQVYRHYVDKIAELEEQIQLMDTERENYQVAIQTKREQIEPLQIRIQKAEARRQELEEITRAADAQQLYTRAQEEVAQTVRLWR
ncbi:MAG: caspase family protein [Phaeodactylibacter sp.]|nr:caspase family protein [Phaeodactylibacter sp.]